MPRIKPFYALRPALHLQNAVVTRPLENYSLGQARLLASENACNFLHLISPELEHTYLRGSRQELIYKKINENLEYFIDEAILVKDDAPCLYIYQTQTNDLIQTGIWTLTHIDAYLNGQIKKHELTVERREKALSDYLQQTGIDANPVLLTYPQKAAIDEVIQHYTTHKPDVEFSYTDQSLHRLWKVENEQQLMILMHEFSTLQTVYIADGHHRMASMAKMALQKRSISSDHESPFNYFSSAYFSTEEIKILAFNRLVRDLAGLTVDEFMRRVALNFDIEKADQPLKPQRMHQFGMYIAQTWYQLTAKPGLWNETDPVSVLDVTILQDFILEPILAIHDPRTDARISFEGELTTAEQLQQQVDNGIYEVVFTLFPTSVQQLIDVADDAQVMPPKSTWVEPKFLVGMLTYYFG